MTYKEFKSQKNELSIKDIREANQKSLRAFEVLSRGANNQIDQVLDWIVSLSQPLHITVCLLYLGAWSCGRLGEEVLGKRSTSILPPSSQYRPRR